MKTPKSVDIDITSRCNLQCKYCFHRTSPADTGNEISTEDWLSFFAELGSCAVMEITIGGGEPCIRTDLGDLIDGIVKNRMRFSILSNGSLITRKMAEYIVSTGRCNSVQISIDGSRPEIHDLMRGSGSFERAIKGIYILREAGVRVTSRVTITRGNIGDLENIAKLLLNTIGLDFISTNSVCHLGLARTHEDEVSLNATEQSVAMEKLMHLAKIYKNRIISTAGPLSQGRNYQEMESARSRGLALPGRGYLTGCGCMWHKMAVRPDGIMVPCGMLSHIELGKINKDQIRDVWQTHHEFIRLRERYKISLDTFEECKVCEYKMTCTGNCPASSYTRVHDVYAPSPDGCLKRYLQEGGHIIGMNESL
ncbi:MAG TPA: SynChlorMet cassette radical SAM/SPASM protein ScmE [Methanospirillum sp.]|uniref:SynChlorMet cassette radical SAM/SPASM protein ScmE n=1 Tax=Methanospirillum sp. TaxID=45200 RepID=UPI002C63A953|nr:SynChlorMet cassette radical SAM/SPASM protein ScmE [Methanospirillum sp.]HWQ63304.1 SynChlorMet cassette radical SAM/SPASM protein ScmE [Methanospirillum sp.]